MPRERQNPSLDTLPSHPPISTNMAPIDEAIAAIEARDQGEHFVLKEYADRFGVDRSTLGRRLRRQTSSAAAKATHQLKLHPHQESKLIEYITTLSRRGLAPTRTMIRNFAGEIAHTPVSTAWVTRFLRRNRDHLISKWTPGMDVLRHNADSHLKYKLYFELLHRKMKEYNIQEQNTYNMDEKGFMIGVTGRSKRVFSKRQWERKEVRNTLQDGSREWITLLAAVCADGEALPPGLIYQSAACTLQPN
jgi:AraC-like DNA-binding protein